MWRTVQSKHREKLVNWAIEFTGNHELYGYWMRQVIYEWRNSCEQNLTDTSQNRLAWIGHAAVCLAIDIPEDITREAWGKLSDRQQRLANNEARKAIKMWEKYYSNQSREIYNQMAFAWIPGWNSRRGFSKVRGDEQSAKLQSHLQSALKERYSVS